MLKSQTLRVLATGVGTLQFSARGELRSDVMRDLDHWSDQAKAEGDRASVTLWRTGTPFLVKDHGARGYSFVLTSDDMDVTAGSSTRTGGKAFPLQGWASRPRSRCGRRPVAVRACTTMTRRHAMRKITPCRCGTNDL